MREQFFLSVGAWRDHYGTYNTFIAAQRAGEQSGYSEYCIVCAREIHTFKHGEHFIKKHLTEEDCKAH